MIKTISVYSLPEGTDPDEFWKYHTEVHGADVRKAAGPGLKKFVINRVTQVLRGEQKFWGVIEMWWESKEAMDGYPARAAAFKTATGKSPLEDFKPRVIDSFGAIVQEKEIISGK